MSPKAIQYKTNSIIYFKGDVSDRVYILKSGSVSLNSTDIETGQELHDLIQTGEFFGVKSALGKYPREETAVVLKTASVLAFTVPEFEKLAMSNTRIIMKMLRVFSNQLRRIHKQVQNLLSSGEQANPETGLFTIGEYYMKNKRYAQALYAFRRYITYYPSGVHASASTEYIQKAEEYSQAYGEGAGPNPVTQSRGADMEKPAGGSGTNTMSDVAKRYYEAVSLFSRQMYPDALKVFQEIREQSSDKEYAAKAEFEIGRCFFQLGQYDKAIMQFTNLVKNYPRHPDLLEALYHVGRSYEQKEESAKAKGFYQKITSMASDGEPILRKAKKALKNLEGSA